MKMATDPAGYWTNDRRLMLVMPAALLVCFSGGCAGWPSLGQGPSPLTSFFWNRPAKTVEVSGYDDYAAAASAAHPNLERELAVARHDVRSQAKDPLQNPSRTQLLARSDEAEDNARARRGALGSKPRERTVDSSIRVTLGRPESLQTLTDAPSTNEPIVASAPVTNWHRSGDGRSTSRRSATAAAKSSTSARARAAKQELKDERLASSEPHRNGSEAPAQQKRAENGDDRLFTLIRTARSQLDAMSSYQVTMTRVERVGGLLQTEDDVLLSVRRKPRAVRLEWASGPTKGREVIYSQTLSDHAMYVNMANSSLPMPRMAIPIDSPLALRNSRHPITEAGFDTIIDNMLRQAKPGSVDPALQGKLVYKGLDTPRGLDEPCHLIERTTPQGETWQVYLQKRTLMPVLVSAVQTQSGELIERYSYRNLKPNPPELASAEAFDPDKRWGESKSWLSRLARAAGGPADASPGATATR
jgi:hypothetical protein